MTTKPILLLSSHLAGNTSSQEDCDCDCACASSSGFISDAAVSPNSFLSLPDLYCQAINSVHYLIFNPKNNPDVAVLNSSALDVLESFRPSRTINDHDDIGIVNKMQRSGLLNAYELERQGLCDFPPKILSAWLHLTDRCNLRCSYCYLPHVREDMSPETGRAAIDAIFRSAVANKFQQVKIKYAGGESLLRYPLILELHSYAKQLSEIYGLSLEEVVLSNGNLLTEEMAKTLKSLDIRLMISMDGMGHYHDSQRPYAGGRGSFKDVSDAVDLALSHELVPNISVTVSSRTAEGLPDIMEWILERELPFSLNFYRENELSASHIDMQLDEQKIINGMKAAFRVIEDNLPRRGFLGGIIDRANLSAPHTHTCGVGQNYLVFDQNGQVAKCQMHIRKPITNIHVEDPLAVIRADQIGIQNISVEEKEGCKTCEWKYWCTGGCPLATHRATGRYDVKSPNCNIYKALYPEALRLEGLRLLKYGNGSQEES
jgi:uncharacterized protein